MAPLVFAAVLFAAGCHACWNAAIKRGLDPLIVSVAISNGAAAWSVAFLPLTGLPNDAAWPWILASVAIHLFYFIGLIEGYRAGDLSQVYPVARGAAPLMTALLSGVLVGEWVGLTAWWGIALLAAGVVLLSLRGGRELPELDRRAVGFALFTAMTVCAYTLVDGVGVRASGNPAAYSAVLFVGVGPVMTIYALAHGGGAAFAAIRADWRSGLIGGALQLGSYGIALWAMTLAPIAIVGALRETSVLFGALIAVVFLKEPLRAVRVFAALIIVAGLVLIRL